MINKVLTKHLGRNVFKGVFPASQLPPVGDFTGANVDYPFCFVANTDTADKTGQHWVAFYFDKTGMARYFDSFGREPCYRDWLNYLSGNSKLGLWDYCRAEIQSLDSIACGEYCIYYLIKRHFTPLDVQDYALMSDVKEMDVINVVKYIIHNM